MSGKKILGIILLAAGILALAYGGFSYTKDTHEAKLGPLQLQYKEKKHVNVPTWAGVAAIVVGGGLLLVGGKK
jgi:TRAP-type C4-dicarboxylate transport system permease small subunit